MSRECPSMKTNASLFALASLALGRTRPLVVGHDA